MPPATRTRTSRRSWDPPSSSSPSSSSSSSSSRRSRRRWARSRRRRRRRRAMPPATRRRTRRRSWDPPSSPSPSSSSSSSSSRRSRRRWARSRRRRRRRRAMPPPINRRASRLSSPPPSSSSSSGRSVVRSRSNVPRAMLSSLVLSARSAVVLPRGLHALARSACAPPGPLLSRAALPLRRRRSDGSFIHRSQDCPAQNLVPHQAPRRAVLDQGPEQQMPQLLFLFLFLFLFLRRLPFAGFVPPAIAEHAGDAGLERLLDQPFERCLGSFLP